MNDKKLKDMWKSAEYLYDSPEFDSSTIGKFLPTRSGSIASKIKKMFQVDLVFKSISGLLLFVSVILYSNVQPKIAMICGLGILLLIPLLMFEVSSLKKFVEISDHNKNTKDRLSEMLVFLRTRSFSNLLSISSTYLFGFCGGMLVYFFLAYGQLRRIGTLDIIVFPTICILGIIMNYIQSSNTIKFQIKHLQICLSDINEDLLPIVSDNIDTKQKTEKIISILVMVVVFLAFFVLIAILKKLGL